MDIGAPLSPAIIRVKSSIIIRQLVLEFLSRYAQLLIVLRWRIGEVAVGNLLYMASKNRPRTTVARLSP